MPESERVAPEAQDLASYGCGTIMHVVPMVAPRLDDEDHMKDLDFTGNGIETRWLAGRADARSALARKAWMQEVDPAVGVAIHNE